LPRPYKGAWEATARRRTDIVNMYNLGWSAARIGREVHLSTSTVYYHLRVAKRARRGRQYQGGKLGKTAHNEIRATILLYESGLTLRETASALGLTHSTVRYRLLGAGVQLRPPHKNNSITRG
jgi:DNA-directed RNA polymerase specialized sigma24 family protein